MTVAIMDFNLQADSWQKNTVCCMAWLDVAMDMGQGWMVFRNRDFCRQKKHYCVRGGIWEPRVMGSAKSTGQLSLAAFMHSSNVGIW